MKHVFYDTETTGTRPAWSQVLQFAAVLTDDDFNELASVNVRCRLLPHVVPTPWALKVTGMAPTAVDRHPVSFYEMILGIHRQMKDWGAAYYLGFNSIKFDEEIMRQSFWQNLLDPYVTNTGGARRGDVLSIMRAALAAQPDILNVPTGPDGKPVHKLEKIAALNGFDTSNAHDALADVRATVHMARLLRDRAPAIWDRAQETARKQNAEPLVARPVPFVLHSRFGAGGYRLVVPVCGVPGNGAAHIVFDLARDPTPLLALSADELVQAMAERDCPLLTFRANAQPVAFERGDRRAPPPGDEPDDSTVRQRVALIVDNRGFCDRVARAAGLRAAAFGKSSLAEERIYDGFAPDSDRDLARRFHLLPWEERLAVADRMQDDRLRVFAERLIWLHRPNLLERDRRAVVGASLLRRALIGDGARWTTVATARQELCPENDPDGAIATWLDAREHTVRAALAGRGLLDGAPALA